MSDKSYKKKLKSEIKDIYVEQDPEYSHTSDSEEEDDFKQTIEEFSMSEHDIKFNIRENMPFADSITDMIKSNCENIYQEKFKWLQDNICKEIVNSDSFDDNLRKFSILFLRICKSIKSEYNDGLSRINHCKDCKIDHTTIIPGIVQNYKNIIKDMEDICDRFFNDIAFNYQMIFKCQIGEFDEMIGLEIFNLEPLLISQEECFENIKTNLIKIVFFVDEFWKLNNLHIVNSESEYHDKELWYICKYISEIVSNIQSFSSKYKEYLEDIIEEEDRWGQFSFDVILKKYLTFILQKLEEIITQNNSNADKEYNLYFVHKNMMHMVYEMNIDKLEIDLFKKKSEWKIHMDVKFFECELEEDSEDEDYSDESEEEHEQKPRKFVKAKRTMK